MRRTSSIHYEPIDANSYRSSTKCSVVIRQISVNDEPRWHISIRHPWRNPSWEEIKDARNRFVPGEVTMAMLVPQAEVELENHCFHLYEIVLSLLVQLPFFFEQLSIFA